MTTKSIRTLLVSDGRRIRVPGTKGWTATARLEVCRAEISHALTRPIQFAAAGLPHAGRLKVIAGRPDVMCRLNGGVVDREHRVSIHVVRPHHEAMLRQMKSGRVFQFAVAAVDPQRGGHASLAITSFDYALIAAEVDRAFTRRSLRRLNLTVAARREGESLSLRIPELDVPVPAGLDEVLCVLRGAAGSGAAALLTTAERVGIVAAVMELGRGLQTSVAVQDARTKVAHDRLRAVGLPNVPPHGLLGRAAPGTSGDVHTLARTDLIGAAHTRELLACPEQALTLVEVEHRTDDAFVKLKDRVDAALALGLRPTRCVAVVPDEKLAWFEHRLARASEVLRGLTSVEPMSRWYEQYCVLRERYVGAQRARVRRAAA